MIIPVIIFTVIFIYLAFSTLLYGTGLAGDIGNMIGGTNIKLFGNFAYINMFLLFYPIYKIQQKPSNLRNIDFYTGWLLFFISLIILSSLIFDSSESGILASGIYSFLVPYIGKVGIWLVWIMIFLLYLVLTVDDDFNIDDLNQKINYIKDFVYYLGDKIYNIKIPQKSYDINFSKIIRNPFENPNSDILMQYNPNIHDFIDPRENIKVSNKIEKDEKDNSNTLSLKEILESKIFKESKSPLTITLGEDIVGSPFITDLKSLPHLLIAGRKGSGKSMGINAIISSLLYKNNPNNLKLLLIDLKMLNFSIYNNNPYLLTPIITEIEKAVEALSNLVLEMDRRYKLIAENKVKEIDEFNEKMEKEYGEKFPFIVIFIDELEDLIMSDEGKKLESFIIRLAKRAEVVGIHLVIATEKPTNEIITNLIKVNIPSRLSYKVEEKNDSKVILDEVGAESLLKKGEAIFIQEKSMELIRVKSPDF